MAPHTQAHTQHEIPPNMNVNMHTIIGMGMDLNLRSTAWLPATHKLGNSDTNTFSHVFEQTIDIAYEIHQG